jgi:hypothetical protein
MSVYCLRCNLAILFEYFKQVIYQRLKKQDKRLFTLSFDNSFCLFEIQTYFRNSLIF